METKESLCKFKVFAKNGNVLFALETFLFFSTNVSLEKHSKFFSFSCLSEKFKSADTKVNSIEH